MKHACGVGGGPQFGPTQMGGGGGGMAGYETIEIIGEEEVTTPVTPNNEGLDELNIPNERELD